MSLDIESLSSVERTPVWPMRTVEVAGIVLFVLALVLCGIRGVKYADTQYVGPGASVSADVATTARTFATEGVFRLHGVPVNNNPPIGPDDPYVHWPPLLPMLLGMCFRLFGVSERVAHVFMLCVLLATALLIFRLGWVWRGPFGGVFAGCFWLTLPVVQQFGGLVAQQSLAILFVMTALVAFQSASHRIGAAFVFLAVLSAWEPVLVIPGMWLAVERRPELRTAAVAASIGMGTALAIVMAIFTTGAPKLVVDTLQTIKYYAGLSPVYSHVLPNGLGVISTSQQVLYLIGNHFFMLGPFGLLAVILLLVRRPRKGLLITYSLAIPWIVWTIVMRAHMAFHSFELLIAAPLVALALAWVATPEHRNPWSRNEIMKATAVVMYAGIFAFLPQPVAGGDQNSEEQIRYAVEVGRMTPANSIVLAPTVSAVPLYYSARHIVRGVVSPEVLDFELRDVRENFPDSPIYLAIHPPLRPRSIVFFPGVRSSALHPMQSLPDCEGRVQKSCWLVDV